MMITRISALQKLLSQADSKALHFNARLPISLKVLQKLDATTYLLQVGTKTLKTTSYKPLHIGQKYWAQMSSTKDNNIVLGNLLEQPKILDSITRSPLKFSPQTLEEVLTELGNNLPKEMAQFSAEQMAQAKDRAEFEYFGFVLAGLKSGVLSLCIADKGARDGLLQLKGERDALTFSAIMPNLGIIEGKITLREGLAHLALKANFASTLALLQSQVGELEGFGSVSFEEAAHLAPLFVLEGEHLLNVVG
ncbi:hypothetical protein [uncultured Helicobacter sp.]|uniref:hypothetical protein n=1 Tax=uncultured Helicobacter sp. TaxID=175537 RepID=UPI0037519483